MALGCGNRQRIRMEIKSPTTLSGWVAVRRSVEKSWLDMSTFSTDKDVARRNTEKRNIEIPMWAKANPAIKIGRVLVSLIDEE